MSDLLDLLNNADRGDLAVKEYAPPTGPFICQWCRAEVPNDFLLMLNHSPDCYRAQRDRACTSMVMARTHVTTAARTLRMRGEFLSCCWNGATHAFNDDHAIALVLSMVRRASEVWPADRLTWLRTSLAAEHLPEDLIDELTWEVAA